MFFLKKRDHIFLKRPYGSSKVDHIAHTAELLVDSQCADKTFIFRLLLASLPLLKIAGRYMLDGIFMSCTFNYIERDPLNVFYILLLILLYVIGKLCLRVKFIKMNFMKKETIITTNCLNLVLHWL